MCIYDQNAPIEDQMIKKLFYFTPLRTPPWRLRRLTPRRLGIRPQTKMLPTPMHPPDLKGSGPRAHFYMRKVYIPTSKPSFTIFCQVDWPKTCVGSFRSTTKPHNSNICSVTSTGYGFSLYSVYLEMLNGVADEYDVCVAVNNGEISRQSFHDHSISNVHLPIEFSSSVIAGCTCFWIVSVVEARYRHVSHNFTRVSTKSHEQKVINLMCSKADLVEVDRHVSERFVCHNKYNIAIWVSTNCQLLCEVSVVQRRSLW